MWKSSRVSGVNTSAEQTFFSAKMHLRKIRPFALEGKLLCLSLHAATNVCWNFSVLQLPDYFPLHMTDFPCGLWPHNTGCWDHLILHLNWKKRVKFLARHEKMTDEAFKNQSRSRFAVNRSHNVAGCEAGPITSRKTGACTTNQEQMCEQRAASSEQHPTQTELSELPLCLCRAVTHVAPQTLPFCMYETQTGATRRRLRFGMHRSTILYQYRFGIGQ